MIDWSVRFDFILNPQIALCKKILNICQFSISRADKKTPRKSLKKYIIIKLFCLDWGRERGERDQKIQNKKSIHPSRLRNHIMYRRFLSLWKISFFGIKYRPLEYVFNTDRLFLVQAYMSFKKGFRLAVYISSLLYLSKKDWK